MARFLAGFILLSGLGFAQNIQSPVLATRIYNITNGLSVECGADCIDNRSVISRSNTSHAAYCAGTGTWTVTLQFSDSSSSGPWSSFGTGAAIDNTDDPPLAWGIGFHPFIKLAMTGSPSCLYTATKDYYAAGLGSGGGGSVTFPITVSQGGTGITSVAAFGLLVGNGTSPLAVLSLASGGAVVTNGTAPLVVVTGTADQAFVIPTAGGTPTFGTLKVPGGGTGSATLTAHGVLMGEGASSIAASAAGTAGQAFLSGGASADGAYAALNLAGGSSLVTGVLPNANTTAASANTASAIVARDGSGNFTAGTITAALVGNVTGQASTISGLIVKANTPFTTKGDLWVTDGTLMHRLAVGTNGQILTADSAQTDGVKWAAVGGTGTVTSIATSSPILGGTITTTGTISCPTCVTSAASLTNNQLMLGAGTQGSKVGNLTGDVTTAGGVATTLATVNATVGSFTCVDLTVNGKGLITTAANGTCGGTALPGQQGNDFRITKTSTSVVTVSPGSIMFGNNSYTIGTCTYTITVGTTGGTAYLYGSDSGQQVLLYPNADTITASGTNCNATSAASPALPTNVFIRYIGNISLTGGTPAVWNVVTQNASLAMGFYPTVTSDLTISYSNGTALVGIGANVRQNGTTNIITGGDDFSGAASFIPPVTAHASLPAAAAGNQKWVYECSDCVQNSNPCAAGGAGSMAVNYDGTKWTCGSPLAYTGSAALNFGNMANGACDTDLTISLTGAAANDRVAMSLPAAIQAGLLVNMWVSAADTVSVRECNFSGGALDPASGTFGATLLK